MSTSRNDVDEAVRRATVQILMLEGTQPESIDAKREGFLAELGGNSIDALELIVSMERKFNIEFADNELNLELVRSLEHFVDAICVRLNVPIQSTRSD